MIAIQDVSMLFFWLPSEKYYLIISYIFKYTLLKGHYNQALDLSGNSKHVLL